MQDTLLPNWQDPALIQNPYPNFKSLQERSPVVFDESRQIWLVSGYEDVSKILRDPRFSNDRMGLYLDKYPAEQQRELSDIFDTFTRWMVYRDGSAHELMRAPLVRVLAMQAQRSFIEVIREELERCFASFRGQSEVDLFQALAYPFPLAVICRLMALPIEDGPKINRWSQQLAAFIDQSTQLTIARQAQKTLHEFWNYVKPIWAERRSDSAGDLLSLLKKTANEHPLLTEADILSNILMLFMAGHETSSSMLCNGIQALWQAPDQLAKLKNNLSLIPAAIDEMLRFDAPIQRLARVLTEDLLWNQQHAMKKGQLVVILLGAANRDAKEFSEAQSFRIERSKNRHLSFSMGAHYCLGAQLARMEGQMVLEKLLAEFPKMQLLGPEPAYLPNLTLRCRSALRVRLG